MPDWAHSYSRKCVMHWLNRWVFGVVMIILTWFSFRLAPRFILELPVKRLIYNNCMRFFTPAQTHLIRLVLNQGVGTVEKVACPQLCHRQIGPRELIIPTIDKFTFIDVCNAVNVASIGRLVGFTFDFGQTCAGWGGFREKFPQKIVRQPYSPGKCTLAFWCFFYHSNAYRRKVHRHK